ncbi:MAG: hypothetical protein ACOZQL_24850 [Myxococcota bacterium]
MELTLADWWALDEAGRSVVVDQLLERMPPGYVDPRSVGHAQGPLPQFIHQETNVLFHVVFGGPAVLGMSHRRFERLRQISVDEDEDLMAPVPNLAEAHLIRPEREVQVRTALVADQPLAFGVLRKLGLDEARITIAGVSPIAVGALLRALTAKRWRAPSEAEWEYACRAVDDAVADTPVVSPTGRLATTGLEKMGERVELCRDDWSDDLEGYPPSGARGSGHEVLRGWGDGARFCGWSPSPSWKEALWPGRRRLAQWTRPVAIRPWVDLVA